MKADAAAIRVALGPLEGLRSCLEEEGAYTPQGSFLGLGHRFSETRAVVAFGTGHPKGSVFELSPWDGEQEITIPTGMEDCILGVAGEAAVLCLESVLQHLEENLGDRQSAEEWFGPNYIGAWIGLQTPIFMESADSLPSSPMSSETKFNCWTGTTGSRWPESSAQ